MAGAVNLEGLAGGASGERQLAQWLASTPAKGQLAALLASTLMPLTENDLLPALTAAAKLSLEGAVVVERSALERLRRPAGPS